MKTAAAARRWLETWLRAWPANDVEAIAAVYRDDARYASHPFRPADTARSYVTRAFADEQLVQAWFGQPVVAADRAAVEYWAVLRRPDGDELTIAGAAFLRFDEDGVVTDHRDYWTQTDGRHQPPPSWGA